MTDKELLELAAKAAGIEYSPGVGGGIWIPANSELMREWNSCTDDGDCARLEAKLMINVKWFPFGVMSTRSADECYEYYVDHGGDKSKARRCASTRAAASIGKASHDQD